MYPGTGHGRQDAAQPRSASEPKQGRDRVPCRSGVNERPSAAGRGGGHHGDDL